MFLLLAVIGFIVMLRASYKHYVTYQQLKLENECLREQWKKSV